MVRLTEHFTLSELTHSETAIRHGLSNRPGEQVLVELVHTALLLEEIRALLGGQPITITSGYREAAVNGLVGGARDSAHLLGAAADFVCPGFGTPLAICRKLEEYVEALEIDQLIYEGSWVHLGRAAIGGSPRGQVFTIQGGLTTMGLP